METYKVLEMFLTAPHLAPKVQCSIIYHLGTSPRVQLVPPLRITGTHTDLTAMSHALPTFSVDTHGSPMQA